MPNLPVPNIPKGVTESNDRLLAVKDDESLSLLPYAEDQSAQDGAIADVASVTVTNAQNIAINAAGIVTNAEAIDALDTLIEEGSYDGIDGVDGKGWTGGEYDEETGVVTFSSTDGLGFSTGDLRGADGLAGEGDSAGIIDAPDDGKQYLRESKRWVEADVEEAPVDGQLYTRQDGAWAYIDELKEAPVDGKQYGRQDKGWAEIVVPEPDGYLGEAPVDGGLYARGDQQWTVVPEPDVGEAPSDGGLYVRGDGQWSELPEPPVAPSVGVGTGGPPAGGSNGDIWIEVE